MQRVSAGAVHREPCKVSKGSGFALQEGGSEDQCIRISVLPQSGWDGVCKEEDYRPVPGRLQT